MSEPHPYEDDLNHSYLVGISSGFDKAAGLMEEKAMEAFRLGCDKEATLLRSFVKIFRANAKASHPGPRK